MMVIVFSSGDGRGSARRFLWKTPMVVVQKVRGVMQACSYAMEAEMMRASDLGVRIRRGTIGR